MIRKAILYSLLLCLIPALLSAQEVVTGLQSNRAVRSEASKIKSSRSVSVSQSLELPFFDDFSGVTVFPDARKWTDNFVFVNDTYSDRQLTTGIATFDALDGNGRLYESASHAGFEADHLTSSPINLSYKSSDNIWLSFFYQPGGLGDVPEKNDSLTLQFLAPDEDRWYSVWRVGGTDQQDFRIAMIKIDNSRYLKNGFRFRFINYASTSPNLNDPSMIGNCDMWNLDYVLLNRNRNANDTVFRDVAFRLPIRSLLKTFEAMPWKQFRQVYLQEMGSALPVHYRNNDIIVRNVTRDFEIWDVYGNRLSQTFTAGATNIAPGTSVDYNANLIYTFNTAGKDSALFRITCMLKTDEFDPKANDTIVYYQHFDNYMAYDDGSAEGGYGINGLGSRNAMCAYRFTSYMQDTIRAINICFNDSYLNANKRAFDLVVWNDRDGIPGDIIYSKEELMVVQGQDVNGFFTYHIPEGVMVNSTFYIGWRQRSETFLNVGFDVNTPNKGRQLYWLNGEWRQSQAGGTIMIRPLLGDRIKTTSIDDILYGSSGKISRIKVWPNPATDWLYFESIDPQYQGSTRISILDLQGRELLNVQYDERVDISSLPNGAYVVVTSMNGMRTGYNRIIKMK